MLVFDRKYVKVEIGLLSEIFLLSETFLSLMKYLCVLLMTSYLFVPALLVHYKSQGAISVLSFLLIHVSSNVQFMS